MSDNKPNVFQITEDCAGLIDALHLEEQQQVMAALASRYKMKLVEKTTGSGTRYKPYPKRKYSN